ncbi:DUF2332 domain-containing protein [Roseibium sp.]|uniref:DUF2332 domain-containing protein n=1 Tax=Roseibium sp. TaxID=1936156 RepID=UPI003A986152
MDSESEDVAKSYLGFADFEAKGASNVYEALAREVAVSPPALKFLCRLPAEKRQPNLLFAALQYLECLPPADGLTEMVLERAGDLEEVMRKRSTQTNEPGRCAALLPILARIGRPLAIIEVGASAGLCLLPDRYGYTYTTETGSITIPAPEAGAPQFECAAVGNVPLADRHPEIVWRRGLDLNPLDAGSKEDAAWLRALVWPEHEMRRQRLDKALTVAAVMPELRVVAGDLRDGLEGLLADVPAGAVPVVFHTAVLSYVKDLDERDAFQQRMLDSGAIWISNEAPKVLATTRSHTAPAKAGLSFLTCLNGVPQYWAAPYGDWLSDFSLA